MCNLYANSTSVAAMRALFGVSAELDRLGNYPGLSAIWPRESAPFVRLTPDGARELVSGHWGFVMPQLSKRTGNPIQPRAVNNCRDDKLRSSPFWKSSFIERRCLIPASAYCEPKGRAPAEYYWFAMNPIEGEERPPFAFAGIWRHYRGRYKDDLVEIDTYSMVTTTPNALTKTIHPDRMPCILPNDAWETWLSGNSRGAFALIEPFPADQMRVVHHGRTDKSDYC